MNEQGDLMLDQLGEEDKSKQLALRCKVRDYLYTTLDRLQSDKNHVRSVHLYLGKVVSTHPLCGNYVEGEFVKDFLVLP